MRPGNRDDMVIRVRLPEAGAMPSAQGGNTEDDASAPSRPARARPQPSALRRLARARNIVRALSRRSPVGRFARLGRAGGGLATLAAVVAAITARAVSGRTFENMGANAEHFLFGNAAQDAQAAAAARASLHPYLLRYVAQNGPTRAVQDIYRAELQAWRDEMRGRAAFSRSADFQANSTEDLIALGIARAAVNAWNSTNGPHYLATVLSAFTGRQLTADDLKPNTGSIR